MTPIFQLIEVSHRHPRRYPHFKVYEDQLYLASSLEKAEEYLRTYVSDAGNVEDVYAFYIREVPVDVPAPGYECISKRVYDVEGNLIDRRDFSCVWECPGVFEGRSQEEVRFKPGDIVDVLWCGEIQLGFVAAVPPDKEEAARINSDGIITLDVTDDSYMVFLGENYSFHQHIDALHVFEPHFKIPERIRQRLKAKLLP